MSTEQIEWVVHCIHKGLWDDEHAFRSEEDAERFVPQLADAMMDLQRAQDGGVVMSQIEREIISEQPGISMEGFKRLLEERLDEFWSDYYRFCKKLVAIKKRKKGDG